MIADIERARVVVKRRPRARGARNGGRFVEKIETSRGAVRLFRKNIFRVVYPVEMFFRCFYCWKKKFFFQGHFWIIMDFFRCVYFVRNCGWNVMSVGILWNLQFIFERIFLSAMRQINTSELTIIINYRIMVTTIDHIMIQCTFLVWDIVLKLNY